MNSGERCGARSLTRPAGADIRPGGSLRPGDTNQVAGRVSEVADDHPAGFAASGSQDTFPTKALRLLETGLHVRNPDVEDGVTTKAVSSANATRNAGAVGGGHSIDECVVVDFRDLGRNRRILLERPLEQLRVVGAELDRIASDDLEGHNWSSHGRDPKRSRPSGRAASWRTADGGHCRSHMSIWRFLVRRVCRAQRKQGDW